MTSSPAAKPVTPDPVSATTPARSLPCPDGNVAGNLACIRPARILASPGLIPAALTWTSTWPGPGTGFGTSTTFRTSTPPYSSNRTAFIWRASLSPSTPQLRRAAPYARYPAGCSRDSGLRMSVSRGRTALVLSFAPAGQALDDTLTVGTDADADLVFYPGAVPLRAVVLGKHDALDASPPAGDTIAGLLAGYAAALAADPWLDSWPAVLEVTPARSPAPAVSDAAGHALPLHPGAGDCWPLFALSAGHPVTVAGEWTPHGLWPLTAWDEGGRVVPL